MLIRVGVLGFRVSGIGNGVSRTGRGKRETRNREKGKGKQGIGKRETGNKE